MRNEARVWCRVGVTITEQSSPKTGKKWENSLIVLTERCQTHSACSGPRLVLSLVLNLIPSKSDQSLLPNWAICTWVATNKKQSVGLLLSFVYHPHSETPILTSFVMLIHKRVFGSHLPAHRVQKNSGNRGSLRVCCRIFLARATPGKIFHLKVGAECLLSPSPRGPNVFAS